MVKREAFSSDNHTELLVAEESPYLLVSDLGESFGGDVEAGGC